MKKILAGAMGGAAALTLIFGAGPASADNEFVGRTYEWVQERYGKTVISSRTGSYLPTEKCIVTGNRRASFADSSGNRNTKILVDLNCNDTMTAGHPGYSVASDQGKLAQKLRDQAANISNNYEKRVAAGKEPDCGLPGVAERCVRICQEAGTCSEELLNYLGL